MSSPRYKHKAERRPQTDCPFGFEQHATKRDAEKAARGRPIERCGRCRKWHVR